MTIRCLVLCLAVSVSLPAPAASLTAAADEGGMMLRPLSDLRAAVPDQTRRIIQTPGLLRASDLIYQGAFRVPLGGSLNGFAYSDAIAFWPANGTLLLRGHIYDQRVAELDIPAITRPATIASLARATVRQPLTDILLGHLNDVSFPGDNVQIGGLLPLARSLLVTAFIYYDGTGAQRTSHFLAGQDFSRPTVTGPYQVGNGEAGFVSGYLAPIPPAWQAALGGDALTGNCCIPIASRTSYGPSVSVLDTAHVGVINPVPATRLLAYPVLHETLGRCDGVRYNCAVQMGGVVWPEHSRSVLFFGRLGQNYCYGQGTDILALHGLPVTGNSGDIYCYDPSNGSKGGHTYPNASHVWAYDANDFVAVKAGTKQPWQVVPYAEWDLSVAFPTEGQLVVGATYDHGTRRLFLNTGNGSERLIQVWQVA